MHSFFDMSGEGRLLKGGIHMRAPFQVLVIPFDDSSDPIMFAVLVRSDVEMHQFVAGGGEEGETPAEAALREFKEEVGLEPVGGLITLDSMTTIPVDNIRGRLWGDEVLVIPEFAFACKVPNRHLSLSHEHVRFEWRSYNDCIECLKWDSDKNALWELNERLKRISGS